MPYKQDVGGSSPSGPTKRKKHMDESIFLARIRRRNKIANGLLFFIACLRVCVWVYAGLALGLEVTFVVILSVHAWMALSDYWLRILFNRYFSLGG